MSVTGAFFTGLSGLDANSRMIDVVGNNITNVNTPGFKAARAQFATQFYATLSNGGPPSNTSGGTNPMQVGLGTRVAGIQRNFTDGGVRSTGIDTNLAIEGNGFFIVDQAGKELYTRDGQFGLSSNNEMVSPSGAILQGYGVDSNFQLNKAELNPITIPLGSLTVAEATTSVALDGNLNANGPISTGGSRHTSRAFYTDAGLTTLATDTTDLSTTNVYISDGAGGSFLAFEAGVNELLTFSGVEKGGQTLRDMSFAVTGSAATADALGADGFGTTFADLADFLEDIFGLNNTTVGGQSLGGQSFFDNATGQLVVEGNEGTEQDLNIETKHIVSSNLGAGVAQPFVMSREREADGEAARTGFVVFDSLGTPIQTDMSFVKQDVVPGGGSIWQWIAESNENDAVDRVLGLGLLEFDANGNFVSATNSSFSLTRNNGATSPLTVDIDFQSGTEAMTALTDTRSVIAAVRPDGSEIGTLDSFSVGDDGVITGSFTNGLARTIGQVVLAKFANNNGLVAEGNNLFSVGGNSGNPTLLEPLSFGAGRVVAGAVEQSNVDLAAEFVNLITASTGFSASSRLITTTDEMIQQLLVLGR